MAWALWRFWLMRDHLGEGRRITEELLALPSARRPSVARARGLSALGGLAYWQREPEQVARLYEEALALSRDLGDRLGEAEGTYNLSFALQLSGDLAGAAVLLRRAVDLYRELGDEINVAFAKRALAMIELELGDHRTAKALVEEALRTFRRHRVLWGIVQAAGMSAALAMTDHDLARALPGTLESLDANVELGHTLGICVSLQGVAVVAILRGSPEVGALIGGAIERIREQAEGEAPPGTVGLADPRELLQTRLPAERLAKLWDEGRTLALEEAVEAGRAWLHEAIGAAGPAP
jgi:tetratricopeptide (TPR) repeat protein